jgi:hypothetical protein
VGAVALGLVSVCAALFAEILVLAFGVRAVGVVSLRLGLLSQAQVEAVYASSAWQVVKSAGGILILVFAGWVAGRAGRPYSIANATALGLIFSVLGLVGTALTHSASPLWSAAQAILIPLPAAMLGGWLASRRPTAADLTSAST